VRNSATVLDFCKDEASRFHELYRLGTGEDVRPPLPPRLRPSTPQPYPPAPTWPYRLAQAVAAGVAATVAGYLALVLVPLWTATQGCDRPAPWAVVDTVQARVQHAGPYALRGPNGCAGLSDGSFAFGTDPAGLRVQELIARHNRNGPAAGERNPTVVVIASLTAPAGADPTAAGADATRAAVAASVSGLQGVYLALHAIPDTGPAAVRILIADLGPEPRLARRVVDQLIATARADRRIVAAIDVGLPRVTAGPAIRRLTAAGLPVLTAANAEVGTGVTSERLFRIAPTASQQAAAAMRYVARSPQRSAALVEAVDDPYGGELAAALRSAAKQAGQGIDLFSFPYSGGDPTSGFIDACVRGYATVLLAGRVANLEHALSALEARPCGGTRVVAPLEAALLATSDAGTFPRVTAGRLSYPAVLLEPAEVTQNDLVIRRFRQAYEAGFAASERRSAEYAALGHDCALALRAVLEYLPRSPLADDFTDLSRPAARDTVTAELHLLHDVRLGREPADDPPLVGVTGPIDFGPYYQREQRGTPYGRPVLIKQVGPDLHATTVAP
jgi:ABC-type branched-subunit amino acid transport system substrate-binding protein